LTRHVTADIAASVVRITVAVGEQVAVEQPLVVLESMKMEIPVLAVVSGRVATIGVQVGDTVLEGDLLVSIDPSDAAR
jgi:acetyl-CoA carboxylase biotin carboxyl carrier protein